MKPRIAHIFILSFVGSDSPSFTNNLLNILFALCERN